MLGWEMAVKTLGAGALLPAEYGGHAAAVGRWTWRGGRMHGMPLGSPF